MIYPPSDFLTRINDALLKRGPLLLPRFGGQRKIVWLERRYHQYYLISTTGEERWLALWEVNQLLHALGLLFQLAHEETVPSLIALPSQASGEASGPLSQTTSEAITASVQP